MKNIKNFIYILMFSIGFNSINSSQNKNNNNHVFSLLDKYTIFGGSILMSALIYDYFKDSKILKNIKSKIINIFRKKLALKRNKKIYINNDELNYKNFSTLAQTSEKLLFNNNNFNNSIFEKQKNELLNSFKENCSSNVIIVYGPKKSGKTTLIENSIKEYIIDYRNNSSSNNYQKNINYFKLNYDFFNIFFNISNFINNNYPFYNGDISDLNYDKIEVFNKNNKKLFDLTQKNSLSNYINYFFKFIQNIKEFELNSDSIFYLNVNEFYNDFYADSDNFKYNNNRDIQTYFSFLMSFLINMKFFTGVKVVLEIEMPYDLLTFKAYIEQFSSKYLDMNNQFNIHTISLEKITSKDISDIYINVIFNGKIKDLIQKNLLKIMVSYSENFTLEDCLKFANSLINKLEAENKKLTKSTLNEFLLFLKNQKNIIDDCVNNLNNINNFGNTHSQQINNESDFFPKFKPTTNINTKFSDVAGNENAKNEIMHFIDYLNNPEKYENFGIAVEKGILLMGPSGTGKTLLAKALAGEAGIPFFEVNGSDFVKMYVGTGSINIKNLFKAARECSPCIIFIDEADALLTKRSFGEGNSESDKALNQFLVELDGFKENNFPILVICATNAPIETLDEAALRPGRIGKHIKCYLPLLKDRIEIVKIHSKNKILDSKLTPEYIAKKTPNFSGAEICELLNMSAMLAFEKNKDKIYIEDIHEAFEKMICGNKMLNAVVSDKSYYETAIHELGHTFCMLFNKNYTNVFDSVSILPRDGGSLGVTYSVPEKEDFGGSKNKEELMADIICAYGGMVAESIFLKTTTNGVSSDLNNVKNIANRMVIHYGMKGAELVGRELSDKDVQVAVKEILDECYKKAEEIIKSKKDLMNIMVEELVKKKVLYADDIKEICKKANIII